MRVLVYGATGTQGAPVARRLMERGDTVRVLTRNAEGAQPWASLGAEVAVGDLTDGSGVAAAHDAVDAVFLQVTAMAPPALLPRLFATALGAARDAGTAHVVVTTSSVIPDAPMGLPAPDARVEVVRTIRDLTPGAVILSPTLLLDNFSGPLRPALQSGVVPQGIPADVPVAYLSAEDQATFAVAALDRPDLKGEFLPIAGTEAVTGPTLAAVISEAMSAPLAYVPMTEDETRGALSFLGPEVSAAVAQMYAWEGSAGAAYLAPDMARTVEALGVTAAPLSTWAAAAFAPG